MYAILKSLTLRELALEQLPAFATALVTAELFYKFHSFTLECLAFVATWYVADAGLALLRRAFAGRQG